MAICGICTPVSKRLPGFSMSDSKKKTNVIPNLANAMINSGWYTREGSALDDAGLPTPSAHVDSDVIAPQSSGLFRPSMRSKSDAASCNATAGSKGHRIRSMKRSKLRRIAIRLRSNAVTPLALHVNGLGETKSTGFKSRTHAVGLRLSSNELSTLKKFRKRALAATSKKIHDRTHGHTDRLCLDSGATHTLLKKDSMVSRILNRVQVHIRDAVGKAHPSTVSGSLNIFVQRSDGSHMKLPSSGTAHVLPSLMHNLLSVSQLCDSGCTIVLKKYGSKIVGPNGDVIPVTEEDGLYFVPSVQKDDPVRAAQLPPLITRNAMRARKALFSSMLSDNQLSLSSLLTEAEEEKSGAYKRPRRMRYWRNTRSMEGARNAARSWHVLHRLGGHCSKEVTDGMLRSGRYGKLSMPDDADKHCDICQRAKFARPPVPSRSASTQRSSMPGLKWHTDVIGPFRPDRDGFRYIVNFVDDATSYTWARAMKLKSDTSTAFEEFLSWLDCEHKKNPLQISMISELQSDRGGEYTSGVAAALRKHSYFDTVCKKYNIKRRFTSAYTPSENGRAERANRTLCDTMRCNLIGAQLGWDFWVHAYMSGVVSRNRIPGSRGSLSHYEKFYSSRPNWARLVPFGSSAHIAMNHSKKDLDRGEHVRMIGYPVDAKGWVFINSAGKVRVTRHARFDLRDIRDRQPDFQPGVEVTRLPGFSIGLSDHSLRDKVSKFENDIIEWSDPTSKSEKLLALNKSYVGAYVHRDFKGVIHRGVVTAYLPPVTADDVDLWQILYDDNDTEQFTKDELSYAIGLYETSMRKPSICPSAVPVARDKRVAFPVSPVSVMDIDDNILGSSQRKRTGPIFDSGTSDTVRTNLNDMFTPSFNKRGRIMTDADARNVINNARSKHMNVVFNPSHTKFGKSKHRYEFYKHLTTFDDIDAAVLAEKMSAADLLHDTARGICNYYITEDATCPPTIQLADSSKHDYFEFCNAHLMNGSHSNIVQRLYELRTGHAHEDHMIDDASWHQRLVKLAHVACVSGESKPEYKRALDSFALQTINEVVCGKITPLNTKEAKTLPEWNDWLDSMHKEVQALRDMGVFELVPRSQVPDGKKVIKTRFVYKIKQNPDGTIKKFKSRLIVQGFLLRYGVDYYDTYSSVVSYTALRTLLSISANSGETFSGYDVGNAYCESSPDDDTPVYVTQPQEMEEADPEEFCYRLRKSLYGCGFSGRTWERVMNEFMVTELGFKMLNTERSVFMKVVNGERIICAIYVDDIVCLTKNEQLRAWFEKSLLSRFTRVEVNRDLNWILNMQLTYGTDKISGKRYTAISQTLAIEKISELMGLSECRRVPTPIPEGSKPRRTVDTDKSANTSWKYASILGGVLYIANTTRPDICYSAHLLTRYLRNPNEAHHVLLKRLVRYLYHTRHVGLKFTSGGSNPYRLSSASDSSFADCVDTNRSTLGFCTWLGDEPNGLISWGSRIAKTVALSTTEAEVQASIEALREVLWTRDFLGELGYIQSGSTRLWIDNNGAIGQIDACKNMKKARHYLTALSRINEEKVLGNIHVKRIDSEENVSDIFTKPLGGALHIRHSSRANGYDMNFLSGSSYHSRDKTQQQQVTSKSAKLNISGPSESVTKGLGTSIVPNDVIPSDKYHDESSSVVYAIIGLLAETGGSVELDIPKSTDSTTTRIKVHIPKQATKN